VALFRLRPIGVRVCGSTLAAGADIVAALVAAGHPVDCKNAQGKTPLHYAVERKNAEMVRRLITLGAKESNLAAEDMHGVTVTPQWRAPIAAGLPRRWHSRGVTPPPPTSNTRRDRSLVGVAGKFG
jgi:hypothetical protein